MRRHNLYPYGSTTGQWWINKRFKNSKTVNVGYEVEVYVDNGFGNHGYIPVRSQVQVENAIDDETIENAVIEYANYEIDEMLMDGRIERYLPGYLVNEF